MSFGGFKAEHSEQQIEIGGWPVIETNEFREMRRIPSLFAESSILVALQAASLAVQNQLAPIVIDGQAPEFDALQIAVYKRAVYATAHADLLPEFATQDRREAAENTAEDDHKQVDRFLTQATRDICLLLGRSVNNVELL